MIDRLKIYNNNVKKRHSILISSCIKNEYKNEQFR